MLDLIQKKYADKILRPYLRWYLKNPRTFSYEDLRLRIYPGVFHPGFFFSTLFFVSFSKELSLKEKHFCEIGSGSGLAGFVALKEGARVTSIELNEIAIKGLKENAASNKVSPEMFTVIQSDLFDNISAQLFDVIFINPPYFFKDVSDEASLAWNCGSGGEYFEKLFSTLPYFCAKECEAYMTLAENCDIFRIKQIARRYGQRLVCVREKKIKWEKNFIFKITNL